MITCMVLAPTTVERRKLEDVEDKVFDAVDDIDEHFSPAPIKVFTLSEFVDACNNEEVLLDISWITYVKVR